MNRRAHGFESGMPLLRSEAPKEAPDPQGASAPSPSPRRPAPMGRRYYASRQVARRKRTGWWVAAAALCGVLLGGAAVLLGVRDAPRDPFASDGSASAGTLAGALAGAPRGSAARESGETSSAMPIVFPVPVVTAVPATPTLAEAVEATRGSVVNLRTENNLGAGVIVDARGLVLTNFHVIAPAMQTSSVLGLPSRGSTRPTVVAQFEDGRELPAVVLIADREEDLAVLRLQPADTEERFEAAALGSSGELALGQEVFAIGNPFGLQHTVSSGHVSALDRINILPNRDVGVIQLDASINVGNSGGPLFALDGSLVGIVTARQQRAQGIAFALPVDHIRGFLQAVVQDEDRRNGAIGVVVRPDIEVLEPIAELGYRAGLLLESVEDDGAAAAAGLQAGDVIVELRGRRLDGLPESDDPTALARHLVRTVRSLFSGERLAMTVVRDSTAVETELVVRTASDEQQTRIDAEELFGIVLASEGGLRVAGLTRNSPLPRRLIGWELTQVMDHRVSTRQELGQVLRGMRGLLRQNGGPLLPLVAFVDPTTQERIWGPVLVR